MEATAGATAAHLLYRNHNNLPALRPVNNNDAWCLTNHLQASMPAFIYPTNSFLGSFFILDSVSPLNVVKRKKNKN